MTSDFTIDAMEVGVRLICFGSRRGSEAKDGAEFAELVTRKLPKRKLLLITFRRDGVEIWYETVPKIIDMRIAKMKLARIIVFEAVFHLDRSHFTAILNRLRINLWTFIAYFKQSSWELLLFSLGILYSISRPIL